MTGIRRRRSRGFTLVEIMTTIGIIALVAVITVPSISGLDADRETAGTQAIMESIAFARDLAFDRGHYGVYFDTAADTVSVFRLDVTTNPPTPVYDVLNPLVKALYSIDVAAAYGLDLTVIDIDTAGPKDQVDIAFTPDGTPVVSADLSPMTKSVIEFEYAGEKINVEVEVTSGRIFLK